MRRFENIAIFLVWSLILTVISVILGLALSTVVPRVVEGSPGAEQDLVPGQSYSLEQLNRAEEQAKERIEELKRADREKTTLKRLIDLRHSGLWIAWLPWFCAPFVLRTKNRFEYSWLLSIPVLLLVISAILPLEIVAFGLGLTLGVLVQSVMLKFRVPR